MITKELIQVMCGFFIPPIKEEKEVAAPVVDKEALERQQRISTEYKADALTKRNRKNAKRLANWKGEIRE